MLIDKIKKLHPDLEIISIESKFITVKNKYGICKLQYYTLLNGSKPSISTAIDKNRYFENQLKEIQPDLLVIGSYLHSHKKILVEDKYGLCNSLPSSLLNGQIPCITSAVYKTDYFINLAKNIHKDKYDYSNSVYKSYKAKLIINCNKHGEFLLDPHHHLSGGGCKKCANEDKTQSWYHNPTNKNKKGFMYIFKINGNNEEFYKFGVTVNIEKRLRAIKNSSKGIYKATLIKSKFGSVDYCYQLEQKFKKRINYHNLKYLPKVTFCGKHECYIN
jgi:hypothetical protein